MQTHKTTKSYNFSSSMCVCVCIFWLKPINALQYTVIQIYVTAYLNWGNQTSQKRTVCFLDSQLGKRQQGYFLWERCAHREVYFWVRRIRPRVKSVRERSRGKWFSVREGFYGGFARIDHKLSSISFRLVRTHTCRRTRWGLITKLPGIQIKEASLKYTKQRF